MNRLIIFVISALFITACQNSTPPLQKPGAAAFGTIAEWGDEHYLLEQDALFRRKLSEKGVSSIINGQTIELSIPGNIAFAVNSASINWNFHDALDDIVLVLKEYEHTSILVVGHADARGNEMVKQLLSQQRAKAIYDYLVRSEIDPKRLTYAGVGRNDLLIQDDVAPMDRSSNRRLVLKITVDTVK